MRIVEFSCLIALSWGLVGCNEREIRTVGQTPTEEHASAGTGDTMRPPESMLRLAPLFPGAVIDTVLETKNSQTEHAGVVAFRTAANVEQVASFYRDRLDQSQLPVREEVMLNGSLLLSARPSDSSNEGVQIAIAPVGDVPGSYVTVTYSAGEG